MKNFTVLWLLTIVLAVGAGQAVGQYTWTRDARNPVLSGGAGNVWNHHVFMPCVLYNTDSSRYEMWFGTSFGSPSHPYQIGFATSRDGINWSMYPNPVLSPTSGTWDELMVEQPVVLRENGQYKMWYSSWLNVAPLYPGYIGFATSPNGILWTKYSGNPVMGPANLGWEGAGGVYSCSVLPGTGGYQMWYGGADSVNEAFSIGHAVSSDGISWRRDTLHNPVLRHGDLGQWDYPLIMVPQVARIGGTYCMWYLGTSIGGNSKHVGLATSTNSGITWTKYFGNPVLSPTGGTTWDGSYVEPGTVLLRGDTLDMWYAGVREPSTSFLWRIGHATSSIVTGVGEDREQVPASFVLGQNYPNPFNPSTTISYSLPHNSLVTLTVYNTLGQRVAQLVNEQQQAGYHDVAFCGDGLASGVYFYRLEAGNFVSVKELLFLK